MNTQNKKQLLIIGLGLLVTTLVVGWFFIAGKLLGTSQDELREMQNNIALDSITDANTPTTDTDDTNDTNTSDSQKTPAILDIPAGLSSQITIAVPHMVDHDTLDALTQSINKNKDTDLSLHIITTPNLSTYKQLLASRRDEIDIALIPTLWDESLLEKSLKLPFGPEISNIYHPIRGAYMREHDGHILPYAIDPLILAGGAQITGPGSHGSPTRNSLSKHLITHEQTLTFGIGPIDTKFLERHQTTPHPLPDRSTTLEQITAASVHTNSPQTVGRFIDNDFWDFGASYKRWKGYTDRSDEEKKAKDTKIAPCAYTLVGCTEPSNDGRAHIGPISSLVHIGSDNLEISSRPESDLHTSMPALGRGFVVPNNVSTNAKAVVTRLVGVTQSGDQLDTFPTLSAANQTLHTQLQDELYHHIAKKIDALDIYFLEGDISTFSGYLADEGYIQMLEGRGIYEKMFQ